LYQSDPNPVKGFIWSDTFPSATGRELLKKDLFAEIRDWSGPPGGGPARNIRDESGLIPMGIRIGVRPITRWSVTPIPRVRRVIVRPIGVVADRVRARVVISIDIGTEAIGVGIRRTNMTPMGGPANPIGPRMGIPGLMTESRR
jgi:hypothetical protein